ncbi:MAG TPA: nicotinate-nucleotide adenylyltransferase [Dehalococcoidia bacterium]|nr:nicotinate-nucleotide adenylyltransferase [Dehalococcoidia bacterium]
MGRVRVGVLGGTFDPIHIGHLVLAEQAREQLALDEVLFVPAGDPWRKAGKRITPAGDRLAMVELGIAGNPAFRASRVEVERPGPSYSVETLAALAAERPDAELYFILGEDALFDLPNWRDPAGIVSLARIAVAARGPASRLDAVSGEQLERLVPGLGARFVRVEMPAIGVSATDLRERVRRGATVRYLIPEAVEQYIRERGLYREA